VLGGVADDPREEEVLIRRRRWGCHGDGLSQKKKPIMRR
jgi:hypothetical protein